MPGQWSAWDEPGWFREQPAASGSDPPRPARPGHRAGRSRRKLVVAGGIGETHGAVRDWVEANGYRPTGPRWEIYGDPDPSTGDFAVEVMWLVAAAS